MKHGSWITLLCLLLIPEDVIAKSLAITLDDSPRFATGYFDGPTRAKTLLAEIERHNIPQIAFFSVAKNLSGEGKERLLTYANAGHLMAHHSNNHEDFNNTSLQDYVAGFDQAKARLSKLPNYRKWYRFPYLREGNTSEKRDGMRKKLSEEGYLNAYITLNNYDWYLENLFQQAIKDNKNINFNALEQLYISLLMESIEYYDAMAVKYLGRSPKHVLLLHEMDITAMYLGNLVDELRKQGWQIISPERAFDDEIAQYKADKVFKYNPGRIGEIAYEKGQKKNLWHTSLSESYIKQRFDHEVLGAPRTN